MYQRRKYSWPFSAKFVRETIFSNSSVIFFLIDSESSRSSIVNDTGAPSSSETIAAFTISEIAESTSDCVAAARYLEISSRSFVIDVPSMSTNWPKYPAPPPAEAITAVPSLSIGGTNDTGSSSGLLAIFRERLNPNSCIYKSIYPGRKTPARINEVLYVKAYAIPERSDVQYW